MSNESGVGDRPRPSSDRTSTVLELRDVEVRHGEVLALQVDRLRVDAGERLGVLGPSGAGKSTLLGLMVGAARPDRGTVRTLGRDPADPTQADRAFRGRIGYLAQSLDLVTQLSVSANITLGRVAQRSGPATLRRLVVPGADPDLDGVVGRLGLGGLVRQRTSLLSGGEQQRVAIGRILYQAPELVVADEPVANLDPARAAELLDALASGHAGYVGAREADSGEREGSTMRTVVVSLHDPDRARRWCDRLLGLRAGCVLFDLPADEVTDTDLVGLYELDR